MAVIDKIKEREGNVDKQTLERMLQLDSKSSPINSIQYLADRRVVWEKYWNVLKSHALLMMFNKKWNAYGKAVRLKYFLIEDSARFEAEKLKALNGTETEKGIEENNPRLAQALKRFSPVRESTVPSLGGLLAALNTNPEFAKSYIQTNGLELIRWIDSLEEGKLKDELRRLVIEISGTEVAEIDKCTADLRSWKDFRIGNNIMFFWNRVMVYLQGGRLEKQDFLGLIRFFKDKKSLLGQINRSYALKSLLTYQRQIKFFEKWIPIVKGAVPRENWEGFSEKDEKGNAFYPNLMGGEKFIELFGKKFGNKDVADRMAALYHNETPKPWAALLELSYRRLTHPSYQNAYIIIPASEDLIKILSLRRVELAVADINTKLRELVAILRRLFKDAKRKSENLRAFEALLDAELILLKKETRAEKVAFVNALLDYGEPVFDFVEESASWVEKRDRIINSYIGAYVYLTRAKLQTLRRRIGRRMNLFSFEADERIRIEEDKIREIQTLGMQEVRKQAREIEAMEAILKERMAQAAMVDEVLRRAAPSYFTRNGVSIFELGYF